MNEIGEPKVDSAKKFVKQINPNINIESINSRIDDKNINKLISNNDIVADCSDNFATRFLVADNCFQLNKTLVSAAILQNLKVKISTWKNKTNLPCYR